MPNVILPNLGIELPDVGSDQDTWGDILNADLTILDTAVQYDAISKTLSNVDVTLTADEAASAVINLTGTLTANVNLIVPVSPVRLYLVNNGTTGAFTVTVKTPLGTGVIVNQGANTLVYSDGTNIVQGATSVNGSFAAGTVNAGTLNVSGAASFAAGTAALPSITRAGDLNTGLYFPAADTVAIATAGVERFQVDSSGNAGLGVTPVADIFSPNFQVKRAILSGGVNDRTILSYNYYRPDVNRYIASDFATYYAQITGQHQWHTAPSGTAGNPITFTQAMTLTQGGNLLVGTTSDGGDRFRAQTTAGSVALSAGDGATSDLLVRPSRHASGLVDLSTGAGTVQGITLSTAAGGASIERARITSGGYFKASNTGTYGNVAGVGDQSAAANHIFQNDQSNSTVASINANTGGAVTNFDSVLATGAAGKHFQGLLNAVSVFQVLANGTVQNSTGLYQSISDRRVKNNIQTLTGSGAFIDALRPRTWEWAEGSMRSGTGAGFIADEFQQVCPEAVTGDANAVDEDGKPIYQAIDPSTAEVIANLVAEIQSLRQRVAALEGVSS